MPRSGEWNALSTIMAPIFMIRAGRQDMGNSTQEGEEIGYEDRLWSGTGQAQVIGPPAHGLNAESDVVVELDSEFACAVFDILPAHGAGERFVLHLLSNRLG